jgi:hypothetical protein
MRRCTLIALFTLVLLKSTSILAANPALLASNPSFDELMNWCTSDEEHETAHCESYVAGVIAGRAANDVTFGRPGLCYHANQQQPAMLDAVIEALKERYGAPVSAGTLRHAPAAGVVLATLEERFTCAMRAAARFEVRGARVQPQSGLAEIHVSGGATIYVASDALLTNEHLRQAEVRNGPDGPQVMVALTREGSRLLRSWAAVNIGQPIAILIDGDLVAAPVIREAIGEPGVLISGRFTSDYAESLARLINITRLVSDPS